MIPKRKRIVDKELLKTYHEKSCVICGKMPAEPHHVTTVGAGGDDVESNLIPLCRKHHNKIHTLGVYTFGKDYPKFREWLTRYNRIDILELYVYKPE